jgi:undecaprenyl-diphosphatase
VPGVSRSGVTMTAALALGMTRTSAARFSFLLSAPITAGAGLMKAKDISGILAIGGADGLALAAGFGTSVVSGLLAIGLLSKLLRTGTFTGFVVYRLLLALTILGVIFVVGGPVSGV